MCQLPDGSWEARSLGERPLVASAPTRDVCLAALRRAVDWNRLVERPGPLTLLVEVVPLMAGVAEAAQVMSWDKRRVITYVDRGSFPKPVQALASGRIWLRTDLEEFARSWRQRQQARRDRTGTTAA
jgi:hypothetical protein